MRLFSKPAQMVQDDEFHKYTADLLDLTKLRERTLQAVILNRPGAAEEVARYDTMIAVAQKTIIRLTADKKSPPVKEG